MNANEARGHMTDTYQAKPETYVKWLYGKIKFKASRNHNSLSRLEMWKEMSSTPPNAETSKEVAKILEENGYTVVLDAGGIREVSW